MITNNGISNLLLLFIILISSCKGQNKAISTMNFENSELDHMQALYYKIPDQIIAVDTSPGWNLKGQKILLTGKVLEADGLTPASGVILYYYQTNLEGRYISKEGSQRNMPKNRFGQTHGYIRGWVKTGLDGEYKIYTVMPGSYPSRSEPAHIHLTIKDNVLESPYYIDSYVFDNDPLLTSKERVEMENRGGSGVLRFVEKDGIWVGERDIYLGLNIPDYPGSNQEKGGSGLKVGEDLFSFTPFHAYGPDKGTRACPLCKYGWYRGILYFVGDDPDWEKIRKWLTYFEDISEERKSDLKVFFIYGNQYDYKTRSVKEKLETLGMDLRLEHVSLTYVPSFEDKESEIYLNRINSDVKNTILIYKRSRIISKYVDVEPSFETFLEIQATLDNQVNEYFYAPAIKAYQN